MITEQFSVGDSVTVLGPRNLALQLCNSFPFIPNMNGLRVIEMTPEYANKEHSFGLRKHEH